MTNWDVLNLDYPGLEQVKNYYEKNEEEKAYEALKNYFATRVSKGFLLGQEIDFSNLDEKVALSAENLLHRTFIYDKPWDMEKCFTPVTFTDKIDWHYDFKGDPEWMYMLNRHNFLIDLVFMYKKTKEQKYLQEYLFFMEEWLHSENDYKGRENSSWRTIDTGIRLKYWCKQLEFLFAENVLPGKFILEVINAVSRQIHYLLEVFQFDLHLALSNWRILEFHGAYIAATFFPELKNSHQWQQLAKNNLEICLPIQITQDGFHWEQSYMYHHEVLLNAVEAVQVGKNNQDYFSKNYLDILKKMLLASTHMIAPDGTQLCYGDSDVENMSHILTLSALVLQPKKINFFGLLKKPDLEFILDYGTKATDDLANFFISCENDIALDFEHEAVGNYFVRNAWDSSANLLFFKNGFLGGGHGHNDLLHLDLFLQGQPVLVDSGRYTYFEGNPLRHSFKDSRHHNTITMDNKEYSIQEGAWGNLKVPTEIKRPAVLTKDYALLQGMHLGYRKEAILNRKIIALKNEGIYFVTDEIMTENMHSFEQHFHFATSSVQVEKEKAIYKTEKVTASLIPLDGQKITLQETELSPSYNLKVPSEKIVLESQGKMTHLNFFFVDETHKNIQWEKVPVTTMWNKEIPAEFVSAYKVSTGENTYLIVTFHQEPSPGIRTLSLIENTAFFGRSAVFKEENGKFQPVILEY